MWLLYQKVKTPCALRVKVLITPSHLHQQEKELPVGGPLPGWRTSRSRLINCSLRRYRSLASEGSLCIARQRQHDQHLHLCNKMPVHWNDVIHDSNDVITIVLYLPADILPIPLPPSLLPPSFTPSLSPSLSLNPSTFRTTRWFRYPPRVRAVAVASHFRCLPMSGLSQNNSHPIFTCLLGDKHCLFVIVCWSELNIEWKLISLSKCTSSHTVNYNSVTKHFQANGTWIWLSGKLHPK